MPPFLFQDKVEELLDSALDCGIDEEKFWLMSIAEIKRVIQSRVRVIKTQMKQNATEDYILADLIGRSVARLFSKQNDYPTLYEIYPALFKEDIEEIDKKQDELSALRFRQFAEHFNKGWKKKDE